MTRWIQPLAVAAAAVTLAAGSALAQGDTDARVAEALSAAPAELTEDATVMDWEGNVLRPGSEEWVCYPTPPGQAASGTAPMCLDEGFQAWATAWANKTEPEVGTVGIGYMLRGDAGASNTDPFATEPDDDWIVAGPHLMVVVPDVADLEAYPTDPETGGPWVMWAGTPYAHLMIPTGKDKGEKKSMEHMQHEEKEEEAEETR